MLYDKVEFPEALETLANRFGVRLPQGQAPSRDPLNRLLEMNDVARAFFAGTLAHAEGAGGAGIISSVAASRPRQVRGSAWLRPDSWDALRSHLRAKGFRPDEMLKGGLVASGAGAPASTTGSATG